MTKTIAILGMLLATTASLATETSEIPDEVSALVRRVEICAHLAGEFGSDDPEHERQLAKSWEDTRCEDRLLSKDMKGVRQKYIHDPRALVPLDDELHRIRVELGIEF